MIAGKLKVVKRWPLVTLVIVLSFGLLVHSLGIVINTTQSMKLGLYRRASISGTGLQRGDIVELCLTDPAKSLGLARHYISPGNRCQGAEALIKEVLAIPGNTVVLTNTTIEVNHQSYDYPTLSDDSQSRLLPAYPRGGYPNTTRYWVIGPHAANSWDSRYYGPVARNQIIEKLQPLLTW